MGQRLGEGAPRQIASSPLRPLRGHLPIEDDGEAKLISGDKKGGPSGPPLHVGLAAAYGAVQG